MVRFHASKSGISHPTTTKFSADQSKAVPLLVIVNLLALFGHSQRTSLRRRINIDATS